VQLHIYIFTEININYSTCCQLVVPGFTFEFIVQLKISASSLKLSTNLMNQVFFLFLEFFSNCSFSHIVLAAIF
jgi:hypothetical protein